MSRVGGGGTPRTSTRDWSCGVANNLYSFFGCIDRDSTVHALHYLDRSTIHVLQYQQMTRA